MNCLGPAEFISFLEVYFGDRLGDAHRKGSDYTIPINGIRDSISIPLNEDPIPLGTFRSLLRKCGIDATEYEQLAGDRRKLRKYLKNRRS